MAISELKRKSRIINKYELKDLGKIEEVRPAIKRTVGTKEADLEKNDLEALAEAENIEYQKLYVLQRINTWKQQR